MGGQTWLHQIGIQSFLCQKSLSTCLKSKSFCKNMSFIINQNQSIQIQTTKQIMNKKIMNGSDAVSKKKSDKDVKIKKKKKVSSKRKVTNSNKTKALKSNAKKSKHKLNGIKTKKATNENGKQLSTKKVTNTKSNKALTNSKKKKDKKNVSESEESDDSDDSDDDESESESEDESDWDDVDGDESSDWSVDSEENFDNEEEWTLGNDSRTDLRRNSAAAVRHNRRFQNLNEFELTQKEKQWFVNCQKQHNLLLANAPDIKPNVGKDLFDENIIRAWNAFKSKKSKKPKGS